MSKEKSYCEKTELYKEIKENISYNGLGPLLLKSVGLVTILFAPAITGEPRESIAGVYHLAMGFGITGIGYLSDILRSVKKNAQIQNIIANRTSIFEDLF